MGPSRTKNPTGRSDFPHAPSRAAKTPGPFRRRVRQARRGIAPDHLPLGTGQSPSPPRPNGRPGRRSRDGKREAVQKLSQSERTAKRSANSKSTARRRAPAKPRARQTMLGMHHPRCDSTVSQCAARFLETSRRRIPSGETVARPGRTCSCRIPRGAPKVFSTIRRPSMIRRPSAGISPAAGRNRWQTDCPGHRALLRRPARRP